MWTNRMANDVKTTTGTSFDRTTSNWFDERHVRSRSYLDSVWVCCKSKRVDLSTGKDMYSVTKLNVIWKHKSDVWPDGWWLSVSIFNTSLFTLGSIQAWLRYRTKGHKTYYPCLMPTLHQRPLNKWYGDESGHKTTTHQHTKISSSNCQGQKWIHSFMYRLISLS